MIIIHTCYRNESSSAITTHTHITHVEIKIAKFVLCVTLLSVSSQQAMTHGTME